ncbi:cytochrome P450 [Streptomyces longwoodensis]|uniref:cytochrome P450 n=1 Tax=Streptomyces longwoodensis TaxID=68231 RepID=UPI002DD8ECE6|nr:cytochrome P450 [Streptomyces longwoodensis]WRY92617.1 cytochrome P450 [Streptomyces longwoodensis]
MPPTPRDADRPQELRFSRMERLLGGHPISTVSVDGTSARFVTDPALVRRILVTDARHYGKSELLQKARILSKSGLLAPDDARHRHYRRLAHPHLRTTAVTAHTPLMEDVARATAASWRPGQPVDIQAAMCRAAGRIALNALLGPTSGQTSALLTERLAALSWEMITKPLYGNAARARRPAHRLRQASTDFRTLLARCITDRLDPPGPTTHYLAALLADAGPAAGSALSGEQVCDEAVMMLTAATVTTASVMSWALYTLARHPLAEEKVLKDLAQPADTDTDTGIGTGARPGHGHGPPGYTLRFLMEVLRLHPPVWITSRRTLTPVTLGEHTLPAGTDVVFSSYLLHRHPAHYRDPHRFDPDRWLTTRPRPQDATYLPFGTGARGCVGETFAWQELHVLLGVLAQEWRLTLQPGTRPRAAAHTTLHPHRLLMIPQPR